MNNEERFRIETALSVVITAFGLVHLHCAMDKEITAGGLLSAEDALKYVRGLPFEKTKTTGPTR